MCVGHPQKRVRTFFLCSLRATLTRTRKTYGAVKSEQNTKSARRLVPRTVYILLYMRIYVVRAAILTTSFFIYCERTRRRLQAIQVFCCVWPLETHIFTYSPHTHTHIHLGYWVLFYKRAKTIDGKAVMISAVTRSSAHASTKCDSREFDLALNSIPGIQ